MNFSLTDARPPDAPFDPFAKTIQIAAAPPERIDKTRLNELFETYLVQQKVKASTIQRTRYCVLPFLKLFGDREWSAKAVLDTWAELKEASKWTAKSLETTCCILKSFERWLGRMGIVQTEYVSLIRLETAVKLNRQIVTAEEYNMLLGYEWPKGKLDMPYILHGLWMTGLAIADLGLLKWDDVNLEKQVITIQRRKSGTPACVPLTDDSLFLRDLKARWPERQKNVGVWPSVNGALYVENHFASLMITAQSKPIYVNFQAACRALGLRKIFLHDFRATFITHCISQADPTSVAMITGHSNPEQLKAYASPDVDYLRQVVEHATMRAER